MYKKVYIKVKTDQTKCLKNIILKSFLQTVTTSWLNPPCWSFIIIVPPSHLQPLLYLLKKTTAPHLSVSGFPNIVTMTYKIYV